MTSRLISRWAESRDVYIHTHAKYASSLRLLFDSANFAVLAFTRITAHKRNLCRAIWLPRYKLDADSDDKPGTYITRLLRWYHDSASTSWYSLPFSFHSSLSCCFHLHVSIFPSQNPWLIDDINCGARAR